MFSVPPQGPSDICPHSDSLRDKPVCVSALFKGRLATDLAGYVPTHIISLLDPAFPDDLLPSWPASAQRLELRFRDVDPPAPSAPHLTHIETAVAFIRDLLALPTGRPRRLLIHCHMGIGRSTAMAYVAFCMQRPAGKEAEAFADLLQITRRPWPNADVVRLADQALGREGEMQEPLLQYRANNPRLLAAYRRLHRRRGTV